MERTFLREMSVIKTLTYCWLRGPSLLTELSMSVCVLLRVWDRPSCRMIPRCTPTSSYITRSDATLTHKHTYLLTHMHKFKQQCSSSFSCVHTHIKHTQAGRGRAKSQESCGLINYHLKETKVMALLSWRTFQRLWPFHPTLLKLSAVWEGEVRAP